MQVWIASAAAHPDAESEDFAAATDQAIVVLDGVSAPQGMTTGCVHGTPWYVRQLGTRLLTGMTTSDATLTGLLADAIAQTTASHADTCDLTHPGTPCATVALLRAGEQVEYLVLSDALIVLEATSDLQIITDPSVERTAPRERGAVLDLPTSSPAHSARRRALIKRQRSWRNRPGGYWIASTSPEAAEHALTGAVAPTELRRAALCTDGAARLVDPFKLTDWTGFLDLLQAHGPGEAIHRVRQAELDDPDGRRWPRTKRHDDATVAFASLSDDARVSHD